jgi:hypothetical protein
VKFVRAGDARSLARTWFRGLNDECRMSNEELRNGAAARAASSFAIRHSPFVIQSP